MVSCVRPAVWLLVCICSCGFLRADEGLQVSGEELKKEVLKWRAEHEARFRSPTGWLALTGHFWLKTGDNRLGVLDDCEVKLPKEAARDVVGSIHIEGNQVTLSVSSGGPLLADGQKVTKIDLPINSLVPESDSPVKLEIGERLKLQLVRRTGRYAVRVRDSQSALLQEFKGKQWFDVKDEFRIIAKFERFDRPKSLKIVNIKGDEVDSQMSGKLEFQINGQTYHLDAIEESPESLFVIFKDRTNGQSTYGAGRFVDVSLPADKDGHVVIDFNKTYSPPCAWSPHTLCPLPPKQNHLPIAIEAGERQVEK